MTTLAPWTRCAATGRYTRSLSSADPMNADARRPARAADPDPAGRLSPAGPVCTLGLDLGTSSAKAVVIDTSGTVLSQASAGYAVTSAKAGYAESEPASWWTAVPACAREAVHAAGARPAAIGLSGQMHGLVLASRQGEPLRPALLWADSRASESLRAYRLLGARALGRLANPLVPGMTGPLLKWVADHEPRTYAEARWALQPKDWIRARLTGEFHAEPSDASASLLYDVLGDRWDLEVVSALGLETGLLAPLLPSAVPAAAGAADTAAAALGSGIAGGDGIQLTVGTGAQVIRPLAAPVSRADAGVNLYRSATPDGWYHMGATVSAGLSLTWVRETMNAAWAELYASADHRGQAHDPLFVPHLSGERTPYCDPALRGSWTSLSLASDRTSLLRSALEGTAFAIRDALDALLAGHRPPHLRLAGGGTLAAAWRQLLADVLGLPLYAVDVPAASGRGAALLGARAAGLLSFADIQGPLAPPARLVAEPDPMAAAFHAERHARFRRTVATLKTARISAGRVGERADFEGGTA